MKSLLIIFLCKAALFFYRRIFVRFGENIVIVFYCLKMKVFAETTGCLFTSSEIVEQRDGLLFVCLENVQLENSSCRDPAL